MTKNLTVSKLANQYGLSRSTLLYYDKIGLLSPCRHQKGEYRTYGPEEQERLKLICLYRKSGIPLKEIKRILDNKEASVSACLISRFRQLDRDILELKEQQAVIANMLQNPSLLSPSTPMTKELWTRILKASGLSEKMMRKWHIQFEKAAPEEHLAFLRFLQIYDDEIEIIRSWNS
jgi:DNA-binding transcriptional MerR regulator